MERSSKITLAVIMGIILVMGAYAYYVTKLGSQSALNTSEAGTALRTEQGESAYTDIAGNPVAIDEHLGKVLVVHSWASWCPTCGTQLVKLAQLGEGFATEDMKVLAVNRAEPKSTATAFLASIDAVNGLQLVLDPGDKFYKSINGYAMPETLFYDTKGNVVFHKRGEMTYEEMETQTQSIIDEAATDR
jgi:thiol-disulfide isomerase/thioredoxin